MRGTKHVDEVGAVVDGDDDDDGGGDGKIPLHFGVDGRRGD